MVPHHAEISISRRPIIPKVGKNDSYLSWHISERKLHCVYKGEGSFGKLCMPKILLGPIRASPAWDQGVSTTGQFRWRPSIRHPRSSYPNTQLCIVHTHLWVWFAWPAHNVAAKTSDI